MDDGDGEVTCGHCGSIYRLRQLGRLDDHTVIEELLAQLDGCTACSRSLDHQQVRSLLVLHDQWHGKRAQTLYYLLCACGQTLASTASATGTDGD